MFNGDIFTFLKPKNELESQPAKKGSEENRPYIPDAMWVKCPGCKDMILAADMEENNRVCVKCGHHFRLSANKRIELLADIGTFEEMDADLQSKNVIDFPEYTRKLKSAQIQSGESESVKTGVCKIGGIKTVICVMDPTFMMGSMGSVTGEKITRAFEYATRNALPIIACTVSGGARMQEGILSLMQMAKTSGAVKKHSDAGLLYITVLTDPTTGGVTASFAMEGDIIISEPNALIAFAGPRVIEQTIRQKLPKNFQTAEFLLEKGFIDMVVQRSDLKETLYKLLKLHMFEGEVLPV
ncbi:MAG: acetyl-CoA carboxylase, carboxyltransferase subunit beta [Bacillota bacterium]|nr:acetyl-CoA carboxylase, carboxyltransferase subunit beta [Bacillota bacterium]